MTRRGDIGLVLQRKTEGDVAGIRGKGGAGHVTGEEVGHVTGVGVVIEGGAGHVTRRGGADQETGVVEEDEGTISLDDLCVLCIV